MHKSKNYYEEEKFVKIPKAGLERYLISREGEVFSTYFKNIKKLHPTNNGKGYLCIPLYSTTGEVTKKGNARKYYVHRLVAETFIPNPENKPCVNHKNNNRADNRVENLEWVTYKENTKHSQATNTFPVGERLPISKLTNAKVIEIREYFRLHKVTHNFLAEMFGVSRRAIGCVVTRKSWKHVQ